MLHRLFTLVFFSTFVFAHLPACGSPAATSVLKWKDGRRACIVLSFDDSAPSQLKNVIPELEKRKLVGTFYLVTGNNLYATLKAKWEAASKSPSVVVANHTFTHKGANNAEELDTELAKCNEVLYALHPARKQPYLLAFGKPGGVPWKITDAELDAALKKHNLVNRPPFAGPPINYHSAPEMIAVVEKAIAKGEMGTLVFHGVGGDWLVTPMEWFTALLDFIDQHRQEIWNTDTASWHKYATERDSAQLKVIENSASRIRLLLAAKTDPTLYDESLTLSTQVPENWKNCVIVQGTAKTTQPVRDGKVQYAAIPGGAEITLSPVR